MLALYDGRSRGAHLGVSICVALIPLMLFRPITVLAAKHDEDAIKPLLRFQELVERIEAIAETRSLANVRFWADRCGDHARALLDDLESAGPGALSLVALDRYRELHGAYLNLRLSAQYVPKPELRKGLLGGTLEQFDKLHVALIGIPREPLVEHFAHVGNAIPTKGTLPPSELVPVEWDGLPHPLYNAELDDGAKSDPPGKGYQARETNH